VVYQVNYYENLNLNPFSLERGKKKNDETQLLRQPPLRGVGHRAACGGILSTRSEPCEQQADNVARIVCGMPTPLATGFLSETDGSKNSTTPKQHSVHDSHARSEYAFLERG
jgi:hypothetical protein